MFDDILSATALIGVASVLAVAVLTVDTGRATPATPASPVVAAARPAPADPAPVRASASVPAVRAMPIHELPRVVVTGHRTRDGDVLADGRTPPPRQQAGGTR